MMNIMKILKLLSNCSPIQSINLADCEILMQTSKIIKKKTENLKFESELHP